jgi:hypothetical protein
LSLRAAFLLLLFANLAFFGWAHLVDVEPEPPQNYTIEHLPRLKLMSEMQSKSTPQSAAPQNPQSGTPANTPSSTPNSQSGAPANSRSTPAPSPPGNAPANRAANAPTSPGPNLSTRPPGGSNHSQASTGTAAQAVTPSSASPPTAQRCVTVGPFNDPERVDQAADLLQQRGFKLRERTEQSPEEGYWVYVGGLKSDSDETAAVRRLEQNGVSDAHAMPGSDKGRRVSVGFFAERGGAERRARSVTALGLKAYIEKRTQATSAHWVDVDINSSGQSLPAEGLLALEEFGSRLEIKECPSDQPAGKGGALSDKTVAQASPALSGAKTAAPASR